jgi:hypothetical protein
MQAALSYSQTCWVIVGNQVHCSAQFESCQHSTPGYYHNRVRRAAVSVLVENYAEATLSSVRVCLTRCTISAFDTIASILVS